MPTKVGFAAPTTRAPAPINDPDAMFFDAAPEPAALDSAPPSIAAARHVGQATMSWSPLPARRRTVPPTSRPRSTSTCPHTSATASRYPRGTVIVLATGAGLARVEGRRESGGVAAGSRAADPRESRRSRRGMSNMSSLRVVSASGVRRAAGGAAAHAGRLCTGRVCPAASRRHRRAGRALPDTGVKLRPLRSTDTGQAAAYLTGQFYSDNYMLRTRLDMLDAIAAAAVVRRRFVLLD